MYNFSKPSCNTIWSETFLIIVIWMFKFTQVSEERREGLNLHQAKNIKLSELCIGRILLEWEGRNLGNHQTTDFCVWTQFFFFSSFLCCLRSTLLPGVVIAGSPWMKSSMFPIRASCSSMMSSRFRRSRSFVQNRYQSFLNDYDTISCRHPPLAKVKRK